MLVNNNISPLPFYDDIALQNHRKDYAFGKISPLITYASWLLPFQVILPTSILGISQVRLVDFNTGKFTDITSDIRAGGLSTVKYSEYTVLKYPGTVPVSGIKYEGLYYIVIVTLGAGSLYSEVFTVTNRVDDYILLEYSNSFNFWLKGGIVDFSDNFKFKCYLNTQVGKPEYSFEEEATERLGYSFIESQVSKKIYKFTFLAPEYLCDALRLVRLCSDKQITCKNQKYDLTAFSMDVSWETQGDLAGVTCSFETDTVIANIGGYRESIEPPPTPSGDYWLNPLNFTGATFEAEDPEKARVQVSYKDKSITITAEDIT